MFNRKAVFLDRDGTLIKAMEKPGIMGPTAPFREEEVEFEIGAYSALCDLKQHDFLRIIVTDQSHVSYGYLDETTWRKINQRVIDTLAPDDVFMCWHIKADNCPFKKPSPMMLLAAADKWGIDLSLSWMVGDTNQDM